ncbi:hypothetical protein [Motilibacter deserti]|uniref:Uncharacterized protein n=1 Tax=Motilibacter deserti TaxID=2714956 RepID=A0ABX0GX24_9ACTN|nr:hypothetical protein [Motilibacter deserti]NHC14180.1 hypothetical protein [Motilibacter deserti]
MASAVQISSSDEGVPVRRRGAIVPMALAVLSAGCFGAGMVWPYVHLGLAGLTHVEILTRPSTQITGAWAALTGLAFLTAPCAALLALGAAAWAVRGDGAVRATWRRQRVRALAVSGAALLAVAVLAMIVLTPYAAATGTWLVD